MKNKRKNNPFFSPEVQNLQDSINRITDAYSGYIQTILSSDLMISQMQLLQEEIKKTYKQIFQSYAPAMFSSFNESASKISEIMTSTIQESIRASVYNNLSKPLKASISFQELQQCLPNSISGFHFHSNLPDFPENLGGLPEDDFVIVDETAIKTYELPDDVCIPVGNSRIKMPTSFLLALIDLIISTIVTISIAIAQSNSSQSEQIKQTQIEESQFELQRAQNDQLRQLLCDIDASSSSEAELIKELKETVEEQNKQFSQIQDISLSTEEDLDNSEEAEDTEVPKQ